MPTLESMPVNFCDPIAHAVMVFDGRRGNELIV